MNLLDGSYSELEIDGTEFGDFNATSVEAIYTTEKIFFYFFQNGKVRKLC